MNKGYYRKMRLLLFYDLPSVEKEDVTINNRFLKNIRKLGFTMLQYSVYSKSLTNQSDLEKVIKKLKLIIPKKGNIIIIKLTEKQYNDMIYLKGEKNKYETIVGSNNVVYFGGENND